MDTIDIETVIFCVVLMVLAVPVILLKKRQAAALKKQSNFKAPDWSSLNQKQKIVLIISYISAWALAALLLWCLYKVHQDEILQRQEIAARPHTVRILDYQITFPNQVPSDYEGGTIWTSYFNDWDDDDKEGPEGRAHLVEWWLSSARPPRESKIQFMVNESAKPGVIPSIWQTPPYWEKIVRTPAGTKEIAGLQFTITRWTSELSDRIVYYGTKLCGVDYLAKDNGKLVGLRIYDSDDKSVASAHTESVLNSFHKTNSQSGSTIKEKSSPITEPDGSVVIMQAGDAKDPAVQLLKP